MFLRIILKSNYFLNKHLFIYVFVLSFLSFRFFVRLFAVVVRDIVVSAKSRVLFPVRSHRHRCDVSSELRSKCSYLGLVAEMGSAIRYTLRCNISTDEEFFYIVVAYDNMQKNKNLSLEYDQCYEHYTTSQTETVQLMNVLLFRRISHHQLYSVTLLIQSMYQDTFAYTPG